MKVYRAFINQPVSLQPLHAYHSKIGIVIEIGTDCTIYFTEGNIHSLQLPTNPKPVTKIPL